MKVGILLYSVLCFSMQVVLSSTTYASESVSLPSVLVAVGAVFENNMTSKPLITFSSDGGNNWKVGTPINFSPDITSVRNVSCAGTSFDPICVAIIAPIHNGIIESSSLVVSNDGGNTWETKSINNIRNKNIFTSVSCTGTTYPICVASGSYIFHGEKHPYFIVSNDHGNTWQESTAYRSDLFLSCAGEDGDAFCIAMPWSFNMPVYEPKFLVSTDGGKSWRETSIKNPSEEKLLITNVSCYGNEGGPICIAVGKETTEEGKGSGQPVLAISSNKGQSWDIKTINNLPKNGEFISSSCTKDKTKPTCVAVGTIKINDFKNWLPIIAVSNDGGNTWAMSDINNLSLIKDKGSYLTQVSCTGTGARAICTAVGRYNFYENSRPLIIASSDNGKSWEVKSFAIPTAANCGFESVRCLGDDDNASCIAAGSNYFSNSHHPFIAASSKGNKAWEVKSISGLSPETSGGFLGIAGSL